MDEKTQRKLDNARTNTKIAVALSNLSAAEISQRAGLSINVLGKFMRGDTMISFANMQAVCDVLDVPLSLITSERQISPARIRLAKILERMSDDKIEKLVNQSEVQGQI